MFDDEKLIPQLQQVQDLVTKNKLMKKNRLQEFSIEEWKDDIIIKFLYQRYMGAKE